MEKSRISYEKLMKKAKLLAESLIDFESLLKKYYEIEKESEIKKEDDIGASATDDALSDVLSVPLCKLTKMIVPNVQRKIDEIVYADQKGMKVCKEEHGADIVDDEGNRYELKVSACKKRDNYKCNFNWPVPAGQSVDVRRSKLLRSVVDKTGGNSTKNLIKFVFSSLLESADRDDDTLKPIGGGRGGGGGGGGGGFKMIARDVRGQSDLNEYFLSGVFVYHYFKRLPKFSKSTTYNFGCERCSKCNEYHRLFKLQQYDERMLIRLQEYFFSNESIYLRKSDVRWTSDEKEDEMMNEWIPWNEVFSKVKSQCD